ncbi:hypothetical protein [Microlunatus sp. GCM10028923]|uniref:hypothetical protein n=1 Tax=Microlunatus sp. GCM10028923 TaxID=3273400 RepID=UPI00361132BE
MINTMRLTRRGLIRAGAAGVVASGLTLGAGRAAAEQSGNRAELRRGGYLPGPGTTGPLPGTRLTKITADASRRGGEPGRFTVEDRNAVFDGYEFWAEVVPAEGSVFRNCVFRGIDPNLVTNKNARAAIVAHASPHFVLENCLIDPDGWLTQRERPHRVIHSNGIRGADFEARWCEIRNVADGIGIVGHGAEADDARSKITDIDRCWIHAGSYVNDYYVTHSDGQIHGDAVQFHTGKNITIRGCTLGGVRDVAGYNVWQFNGPNRDGFVGGSPADTAGGRNTGDDHYTSVLMVKQEVADDVWRRLENVVIEDNGIGGGVASVNNVMSSTTPGQTWSSLTISGNRFFERGPDWGRHLDQGQPKDEGAGYYLLKGRGSLATIEGNTIWDWQNEVDTGVPIPITGG